LGYLGRKWDGDRTGSMKTLPQKGLLDELFNGTGDYTQLVML